MKNLNATHKWVKLKVDMKLKFNIIYGNKWILLTNEE